MSQSKNLLIPEHFDALVMMDSDQEKADYLRAHGTPALRELLRLVFDPAVSFDTPIPEYLPDDSPLGLSFNTLYQEYKRMYLFQPTATHINLKKKQDLLAAILESVHSTEAMLLERVFAKDLSDYDLSEDVVRMAFPALLPARVVAPPPVVESKPIPVAEEPVEEKVKPKRARKPRAKKTAA